MRCTPARSSTSPSTFDRDSPTFSDWFGVELSAENRLALYIPKGARTASSRSRTTPRCTTRSPQAYVPEAGARRSVGRSGVRDRVAGRGAS